MDSSLFDHFIITRFNLKQNIWAEDKLGELVNNSNWLQERYSIFREYCFPSIYTQKNQNFKWLVYFDLNIDKKHKDFNSRLSKEFPNFAPIYVASFKAFEANLNKDVIRFSLGNKPYVITTRLDNDDCLHEDATDVIQKHFTQTHLTVIDLCRGLSLKIPEPYKMGLKNKTSGPFISLISEVNRLTTVYDREHSAWLGSANYISIDKKLLWLQLIHNRNISNELGRDVTFNKSFLKGFNINSKISFSFNYYLQVVFIKLWRKLFKV